MWGSDLSGLYIWLVVKCRGGRYKNNSLSAKVVFKSLILQEGHFYIKGLCRPGKDKADEGMQSGISMKI